MPHRTKKEHKHSHTSGSRWHNFHFSGKLILCSVFFGLMLLLIGGIILAIGMDRDEETKSGDYNDIQKKPPLTIVGPVVMGIGGFTTCVGIIMCLVETKVCRKKSADANPLIVGGEEEDGGRKNSETMVKELDASPRHNRKHRHEHNKRPVPGRKTAGDTKAGGRNKSPQKLSPSSPSSGPISINSAGSRSYLTSSDTFLTPPNTLTDDAMQLQLSRDAENQTSTSLMKSMTNSSMSWNASTDFQTPSTSFNDTLSLECSHESNNMHTSNNLNTLKFNGLENNMHEFITPKNSDAEKLTASADSRKQTPTSESSEESTPSSHTSILVQEVIVALSDQTNVATPVEGKNVDVRVINEEESKNVSTKLDNSQLPISTCTDDILPESKGCRNDAQGSTPAIDSSEKVALSGADSKGVISKSHEDIQQSVQNKSEEKRTNEQIQEFTVERSSLSIQKEDSEDVENDTVKDETIGNGQTEHTSNDEINHVVSSSELEGHSELQSYDSND